MGERARAVVIGGGVTGCSVALHLARAGWTDVLLLDKGELTSGSTAHAAGLVTMFNPSPTMMAFRRYSVELYGELGVFDPVGSLRIASSSVSFKELQRGVSRARGIGLDVEILSAEETLKLMPAASPEELFGSVWVPGDGYLDPHSATYAMAGAARALGVRIRTGERVTGIEISDRREVIALRTERDRIECEAVVDAAGIWAPRVAALAGVRVPSTPVDHQHVALKAVPGWELPRDMPCFRDPDNLVYGRSEAGGVVFGGYEPDPVARWVDGAPWEHGGRSLPPDMDRFEQLLRGAARRFPFIADAEIVKLVCHPDAMTPDANPLVGPVPDVRGLWMAAGLSLNGFGGAGGLGRSLVEWITSGETELDLTSYRPWRFGRVHEDAGWVAELAREAYRYYYLLRYPFDHDELGRPKRVSPLHGRLQEAGAVFQVKHGWERAERCEPGEVWRRAGPDQRGFGWARPPWLDRVGEEHRAVRERAGLFDLSSFGKIEVVGPDALRLLERAAANRVDVPEGSVVYSQMLDRRGGIVGDVTIVRLGVERFRVITGAGAIDSDLGWLRSIALREGMAEVDLRDASEELAVIALWGPAAPTILGACTGSSRTSEDFPRMSARTLRIGAAPVWGQRVSFAGEAGWELFVEPSWAVEVWDRLASAGAEHGLEVCGYRCLDGLRIEKGFRYLGTDLTANDTPIETGLERFVAFDREGFLGRGAVMAQRDRGVVRRLRTLLVGDGGLYIPIYGGEAVIGGSEVVGRVRSCAYGFTVGRNVALASLPHELGSDAELHVEVFGEVVPAELARDILVDADGEDRRVTPTIEEVLGRVSLWKGKPTAASELSGGLTNTNYLVDAEGDRYVVRIPGASTELLAVDRENERHNAAAASTTGVSPRIVEVLEDIDVMVIEFVEGTTMSSEQLRAPEMGSRIASSLRRLHAGPRFLNDFDMFRLTEFYLGVCAEQEVRIPEGFEEHRNDVGAIERALAARPLPTVPCHNDLLAENYIDDGTQLWIVDFEYSGNNDPTFELGDTAQECGFNPDLRAALCEAYFGRATPALLARMELQAVMADVGWTLWAAIQAKISSIEFDFWGWAEERWGRAREVFTGPEFGRLLTETSR